MGCLWSKDDTEILPRINRLPSNARGIEEIRSFRSTITQNSIPQRNEIRTPIIYNYPTSNFNHPNHLQTRQVNQYIDASKVKPTNTTSTNSVGRRKCGPVSVNSIEGLKYRRVTSNGNKVDSKLNFINKKNIEGPKFGKYKCKKCGHAWSSRLCWPDKYQICKHCQNTVFAHSHRELQPSDISEDPEKIRGHRQELCEKCKQLGRYCNSKGFKTMVYPQASSSKYV